MNRTEEKKRNQKGPSLEGKDWCRKKESGVGEEERGTGRKPNLEKLGLTGKGRWGRMNRRASRSYERDFLWK